jgi:hypothetical protein
VRNPFFSKKVARAFNFVYFLMSSLNHFSIFSHGDQKSVF